MNKPENTSLELSIIILSYNTRKLTVQTIESIYQSSVMKKDSYEIVVFDNNSTDDTDQSLKKLTQHHKNLKFIKSSKNLGFSKGNNIAVESCIGKYLLFLNSDIIVHKEAIDKMLDFAKKQKKDFFAGGKLLNQDGTPQPSCGPFYSLPVIFGAIFLRGDYWGLTRYSPDQIKKVDWVSGACLMTKKSTFIDLQGFDERIFMYMEEIDLLYRASKKKILTTFLSDCLFTHLGSASSKGKSYPIQQVFSGFTYFYRKHHHISSQLVLKFMLQFKSVLVIYIASIINNKELANTYKNAQKYI